MDSNKPDIAEQEAIRSIKERFLSEMRNKLKAETEIHFLMVELLNNLTKDAEEKH